MDNWRDLAESALRNYRLGKPRTEFLRHNENLTCKVMDDETGADYVLRIHRPADGVAVPRMRQTHAARTAELEFLQAVGEYTDMGVQRPVLDIHGALVTTLSIKSEHPTLASLLTWVPGQPVRSDDPSYLSQSFAAGAMTARLHDFAAHWNPGRCLPFHSYSTDRVRADVARVSEGVDLGLFSSEDYAAIQAAGERICCLMDQLDQKPGVNWGLIHSDLNASNLIVHNGTVVPIDFGLCGYGHFYLDLGITVGNLNSAAARQALLAGYRSVRPLPNADIRYIEAFFVLGVILFMALHLFSPKQREWFRRRVRPVNQQYLQPLIRDQRFFDQI